MSDYSPSQIAGLLTFFARQMSRDKLTGEPTFTVPSDTVERVLDVLAASPEAPGNGSEEWQQALIDLIDATGSGAFDMEKLRERAEKAKFYRCVKKSIFN